QLRQWIDSVTVSNVDGRRAITTTTGNAQDRTKTRWYSDGTSDWNSWTDTWYTDQTTDDGAVIDPTRISQAFNTGQAADAGTVTDADPAVSAAQGGVCGLTGTIESCLTPLANLLFGCAGLSGPARACEPATPVPGPATGTGQTLPVHTTTDGPAPQTPPVATGAGGASNPPSTPPGTASHQCDEPSASEGDVLTTPQVSDDKLQNIIDNLYKGTTNPSRVGDGTTMDAIRNETATCTPTGGSFHTTKGEESLRGLTNWLRRNPGAGFGDRLVAQSLADELSQVLGGG
ncbi:MAG: hypothetical protein KJ792_09800, partial [Actinobacteria bacterium]|nr:hypothetical protein [Actinomycetota bacterium]